MYLHNDISLVLALLILGPQIPAPFEHGLERPQSPIVVLLVRQHLLAQHEHCDHFSRELCCVGESFRVEQCFGDQLKNKFLRESDF